MDMEYKAFKSHLKMMADRGFSIQESVAFRAPFMSLDLYGCSEQLLTPLTKSIMVCLQRSFGVNILLSDLTKYNWTDLVRNCKLGHTACEHLFMFFYEMSVGITLEFKVDDYYTSRDLSRIMHMPKDETIRQLQLGRFKGAFIDLTGQWRKEKLYF
ncbi:hypothetical protein [Paenibacillus sp. OK003]|uniref:hypothetical protein n=1 Tax=Paenibacillus sp. OK003 TaxID=1884380 RepID=UPI0008BFA3AA|nr:hypothetical protein [Paenibacillus sp. OK003]SEL29809.1 hypothetical protein SAMN05518856_109195 [Paenibacillus sp. OK003]